MESNKYLLDEEIPLEKVDEGIERKILGYNQNIMMVKIFFKKGAIGSPHSHHHTQVSYVEKGTFEVTIGEETKTLSEGDGFFVPPNIQHGVKALEPGILLDVFNPHRQDFIEK